METIDWFSFTIKEPALFPGVKVTPGLIRDNGQVSPFLPGIVATWLAGEMLEKVVVPGRHGYSHAIRYSNGMEIWHNNNVLPMGIHVSASGSVCSAMGIERLTRMMRVSLDCGAPTRIDLAVDTHEIVDIRSIYEDLISGKETLRQRSFSIIESSTGKTLYAGSRTSDMFVRLYDKGGQMGLSELWFRVELEVKGKRAAAVTQALLTAESLPGAINAIVREWFHIDTHGAAAFWTEPAVYVPSQRKVTNTRRWLTGQVVSALAREVAMDNQFLDEFLNLLFEEVDKFRSA